FWWRINAYTEIVAMVASLIIASYMTFVHDALDIFVLEGWEKIVYGAILTTLVWIIATYFTPPDDDETLRSFYKKIRPGGPGWDAVIEKAEAEGEKIQRHPGQLPLEILSMVIGVFTVYSALFATGFWIYGDTSKGILFSCLTLVGGLILFRNFNRIEADTEIE
ncbi:MAG: Na+:solute symporter, partial [Bacteroidota bacterium]